MGDANHVDSPDGARFWRERVEEGNDLLLVRNSDIQSSQVGILIENLWENVDTRNLVVLVLSVDVLIGKLLVEVTD